MGNTSRGCSITKYQEAARVLRWSVVTVDDWSGVVRLYYCVAVCATRAPATPNFLVGRQRKRKTHKSKSVGFFAIPLLHSRARKLDQHYLSSRYPSAEIAKRRFLQVQWCLRLSTCPHAIASCKSCNHPCRKDISSTCRYRSTSTTNL